MAIRQVADRADGRDIAIHRIHGFEGDQLWPVDRRASQQLAKMGHVVVAEDALLRAARPDAVDHRGMVQRIGEDDAAGHQPRQCAERCFVGHISRSKKQGCGFPVEIGQLAFQQDVIVIGAGDISRASGAGAAALDRLMHGGQHDGVLAHPQVIVGAPDDDFLRATSFCRQAVAQSAREASGEALEIGKNAIAPLGLQAGDHFAKALFMVHLRASARRRQ